MKAILEESEKDFLVGLLILTIIMCAFVIGTNAYNEDQRQQQTTIGDNK